MVDWTIAGNLVAQSASLGSNLVQIPNAETWDQVDREWGAGINVLSEDKPVFILEDSFYQEGDGVKYGLVDIPCRVVRSGLTITGKGRKGEWTVDPTLIKEITGIYPTIRGTAGTVVKIRVGAAESADGPIVWDIERNFIVGTDFFLDYVISGRYLAVSFRSEGQPPWELLSYDLEINVVGQR